MKEQRTLAEDRLQQECFMWFHNEFPKFRGLLRYNLNNSANAIQGNKNKAMGLQAGASDMVLNFNKRTTFIELKVLKGVQSANQKVWQSQVEAQGFDYFIVRDKEAFKGVVWDALVQ
jgi:hypothetical protein